MAGHNPSASQLYYKLAQCLEENNSAMAIVTLIEKKGSAPQKTGAKMLISEGQVLPVFGTIGGGNLENYAINFIAQQFDNANPLPQIVTLNLQRDLAMHCGGEVKLLFEFFLPQKLWKIIVFGAGHIAQALVPLLCQLNAVVYCLDDRSEWLDKISDKNNLKKIQLSEQRSAEYFIEELSHIDDTFFICLNRTHKIDFSICKAVYRNGTPTYIGVIGSNSKAGKLIKQLNKAGISEGELNSLYCPVGLQKTGKEPFEIAINICAQIIGFRDNRVS